MKKGEIARNNIIKFVTEYFKDHGYAPSYREIMEAMEDKSLSSVKHQMDILRDEGKIKSDTCDGSPRSFTVSGYSFVKNQ